MLDLLLTLVVIYLAYRIFYQKNTFLNRAVPRSPLNRRSQDSSTNQPPNQQDDDGEYIDYEEVD